MFLVSVATDPPKYLNSVLHFERTKKFAQKYNTREQANEAIRRATIKHNSPDGMYSIIQLKHGNTGKYNATRCYFDKETFQILDAPSEKSIPFDSIFEAKVYQVLRRHCQDCVIRTQYPLLIKPATALYKQLDWCVDFYVYRENWQKSKDLYIEAKGVSQPEFIRNLQYFQFFNSRKFENLLVVTEKERKIDKNIESIGFNEFSELARLGLLIK
jgi:hypothetical protein